MANRILIIEDEVNIARFIELELVHEGNQVEKAHDGREGLDKALSGDYDLILLDVMLPKLNGLEVLRRLRMEKETPVIMLTARDAVMDKVSGLDAGADDYITKPFNSREVVARVKAVLRRANTQEKKGDTSRITYDGLIVDNKICGYSKEQISNMAQNPEKHGKQILKLSNFMYLKSGYYKRLVNYFANMPKGECWTVDTEIKVVVVPNFDDDADHNNEIDDPDHIITVPQQ